MKSEFKKFHKTKQPNDFLNQIKILRDLGVPYVARYRKNKKYARWIATLQSEVDVSESLCGCVHFTFVKHPRLFGLRFRYIVCEFNCPNGNNPVRYKKTLKNVSIYSSL